MLTQEENDRLTRVGPGTPMGSLLRRYWHPLATVAELEEEPVLAARLLGEDLALFRDSSGRLGLVRERCAHRGASLAYGIPEHGGIRCPYHGWLYDHEGTCIEQPAEPAVLSLRIPAYPVQELGGLIWAYLGPAPAPQLPRWDLMVREDMDRSIAVTYLPCNWLQPMENSMDPLHFPYLHSKYARYVLSRKGMNPRPEMKPTVKIGFDVFEYGVYKRRLLEGQTEEDDDWRLGHPVLFPNILTLTDSDERGCPSFQIRVPVDDEKTLHYWYYGRLRGPDAPPQRTIPVCQYPCRHESDGRIIVETTKGQDIMAWITQGAICDRGTEHLATSDRGVVLFRKLLLENIEKVERGEDPLGVIRDPAKNFPMIEIEREHTIARVTAGIALSDFKRALAPGRRWED
jgi:5,5'-dehydrodivanillate O-demethylase